MKKYLKGILSAILGRYEGGQIFTHGKSYLPGNVQDARFDADSATRWEITRKARYWERNNAIVNRLADVFELYTVGRGLPFLPASEDQDWNIRAKSFWDDSSKQLNLCSSRSFSNDQSLIARTWFIDGEIFVLKTRGSTGFARIQLLECQRVQTPGALPQGGIGVVQQMPTLDTSRIFDGVEVDDNGRPIAYWVANGIEAKEFKRIPASDIIHIFEPSRVNQYRGLSFLYPVLNDIHDLDDLQMLEQQAARDAAVVSNVLENQSGEIDADGLRKARYTNNTQNSQGAEVLEQRLEFIKRATGARTIALKTGEKLTQFKSERPGVAQQQYWDYLTSKICAGVGMSKQLVFPWSMQGTVTRADLDIMATFFRTRSSVLIDAFSEIYAYVMEVGKNRSVAIADAPPSFRKVTIRTPRAVNVDVGRNSNAMLAELAAGATTLEKVYADLGEDWIPQIRQRAKEIAFIQQVANEEGVNPSEVSNLVVQASSDPATDPQQQPAPAAP